MKKNVLKGSLIAGLIILLSLISMYLGLAYYYADGFSYNTWINGIYCTGKNVNEVNDELLKQYDYSGLTITDSDGKSYAIPAEAVNLTFDFNEVLELYLEKQNPVLWIDNLLGEAGDKRLEPKTTYDKDAYDKIVNGFSFLKGKADEERIVKVMKGEQGYYLVNERTHVLNRERAKEQIKEAFESFTSTLDLEEAGCYEDLALTPEMKEELALWEKISVYQDCGIIYRFGDETYAVDAKVVCDFIKTDDEGNFLYDEWGNLCTDEEKVYAFVDKLADEYDTVGKARQFHATRGETVTVEGGIYGNKINRKAEKEYLLAAFLDKRREEHEPVYEQMALKQGKDDIGDTYIEVDMTNQMMYYYENGEQKIATPVVTGNTGLRRGTPQGTNYVYGKERNRVLRGRDMPLR